MKLEHIETFNWKGAIRGMRNPLNSWIKSDTKYNMNNPTDLTLGVNDLELMIRLSKAGSDHRKFMRQIFISFDATMPLYWWKQFDTYKIGTASNSCSTMHFIHKAPIKYEDFEQRIESSQYYEQQLLNTIATLNILRDDFINNNDKRSWNELISLLPSSYLQKRTITMTYENLYNMYNARKNHKLVEWKKMISELMETLPYAKELIIH
jgi:hypothetical protein